MAITLVSYSYLEPGGTPPKMLERTISSDIREYLEAHVDDLLARIGHGSIAPAVFRSAEGAERFEKLNTGTKAEFLANAQSLADRLHQRMDYRTKRGFFVALRRSVNNPLAAALKLDVHDAAAAAVRFDAAGEATLEAVEDLLDIPGELQKGGIVPDERPNSQIVVGDKLTVTSLYFLDALDVEQRAAPGPATADLVRVVQTVAPEKVDSVAKTLEVEPARIPITTFFEAHPDLLDDDQKAEVLDRARVKRRPIDEVDPSSYVLRETIEADGITIRGRASTLREKVRILDRPGGFRIQIDVDEQPRRTYK